MCAVGHPCLLANYPRFHQLTDTFFFLVILGFLQIAVRNNEDHAKVIAKSLEMGGFVEGKGKLTCVLRSLERNVIVNVMLVWPSQSLWDGSFEVFWGWKKTWGKTTRHWLLEVKLWLYSGPCRRTACRDHCTITISRPWNVDQVFHSCKFDYSKCNFWCCL